MHKKLIIAAAALFLSCAAFAEYNFHDHRYDALNVMPVREGDIVFVGNSITNMHEWWEAFGCRGNILNRGVSGCVSAETLANVDPIAKGHPAKVFLMVGTNDLARPGLDRPYAILRNVEAITDRIAAESPETEIYIQSILPVADGNVRDAAKIMELNDLYKGLCGRKGYTYVDLWSEFVEPGTTHINPAYTLDGLHPLPAGYRVWCNAISEYVGQDCVYPDAPGDACGLWGSVGMRTAAFSLLPLDEDDVVVLGDAMVHGGEWHELVGSDRVKSRGMGWGFGGPDIRTIEKEIPAIFASGKSPAAVYIHAGAGEAHKGVPVDTILAAYRSLVAAVKAAAPSSAITVMSVQPIYAHHRKVTPVAEVNARLSALAEEEGVAYMDFSSAMVAGPFENDRSFVNGNYLCRKAYVKIGRMIVQDLGLAPRKVKYATRETAYTGRGNEGEVLQTLTVSPDRKVRLRKVKVVLDAEDGDVLRLSVRCDGRELGARKVRPGKKVYRIRCCQTIDDLKSIEICADIAPDAVEGHRVSADIERVRFGLRWEYVDAPQEGAREILLARVKVLGPGDYGSAGYRIPAIVSLPDGSLLTTADKRKYNDLDLPEDIDVIAQRSTDGGRTWSDPVTIAEGKGYDKGFGDAALALTGSGDVLCAYNGGAGTWASSLENPMRNYIVRSTDGGVSWGEPLDCTEALWGPKAANRECRNHHSAFFASGNGLRITGGEYAGRIIFVAAVHTKHLDNRFDNYAVYSDDDGLTWKVSSLAFKGGDEAKVAELPDGRMLMSVRQHGRRGYNVSDDGGATWGKQDSWKDMVVTACDGDLLRVGDSLLLQSVPNDMTRRNVSVFVSRDGGRTWPYVKSLCRYESVYSSLTLQNDGTIGAYIEENPAVGFDMYYLNFSVEWLLNHSGKEKYMDFLSSTMPLPDSLVYPREWWEKNVEKTLEVRGTMNWGVPEREFVHFVLPLRVNNERLDDFRTYFADSLCERVRGLNMYDAVLEINHWCHERVTYRPSDGRTSAPMSTIRYGFGRCGEESVVTVAALRAAGIPARQVYTPRWAHTDDNHAWVEAWVDGKWHFLGACEPEAALDMGWFSEPVSRAMLLHTNVYGDYRGPEDVIRKNRLFTEINVIRNYVPARRTEVRVVDTKGRPVKGAKVEFKIYNYAELYTVARSLSDRKGVAGLDTGLGDIMVWASKDDRFGLVKAGSGMTELVLDHRFGDEFSFDCHIVPPVSNPIPGYASAEDVARNAERMKEEDAFRAAYHKGVVNSEVIEAFKAGATNPEKARAIENVLSSLSQKDFRDVTPDVLSDAVSDISNLSPYVLSPRIGLEYLLPFHREIRAGLANNVLTFNGAINWMKATIKIDDERNPQGLAIPPLAVWRGKICDSRSLGMFYVAVCRSLGFPARIEPQSGNVQVLQNAVWLDVDLEGNSACANPRGTLVLDTSEAGVDPAEAYSGKFSISKVEDGSQKLIDFEYSNEKPDGRFQLESGYYTLVSGNRLADGSVLMHLQAFNVKADETRTEKLVILRDESEGGRAGDGSRIVARLAENGEPTTHALRQLEAAAEVLNAWGGEVVLYGPTEGSIEFYRGFISSLNNVSYLVDADGKVLESLKTSASGSGAFLPYVALQDADGGTLYFSQGYNTSLKEDLTRRIAE
ncbi:MAG: GDSL-type esterase/lipase family protein [Bacteroidales bacterium]|nr:GDSL-type esterase/lipase family protein [Bacteroidales bacterium]